MTATTADTLASIDGALAAYGTVGYGDTGDSMRWRPETPGLVICDGGRPLTLARWVDVSGKVEWRISVNMEAFAAFSASIGETVRAFHDLYAAWNPRKHRRRCRQCNPRGYPPPLAVNGREYRRRLRNRRKRVRR